MAILKLWEQGKLDIHDPVSKYLAGFPYAGITIKNLLSQRSGLSNYVHFMDQSGWDRTKIPHQRRLATIYQCASGEFVQRALPGRHFEYSNTNYALLALDH